MTGAPAICPACKVQFAARRTNQKYCSDNCRKAYYQAKDRAKNPKNSQNSKWVKRANTEFFDRAMRYSEELYSIPPDQRLNFINSLVEQARAGNVKLRQMLSHKILLNASPEEENYFWRQCHAYPNIAQVANNYCRKSWGANVRQVVYCKIDGPSERQTEKYDPSVITRTRKLPKHQTLVTTLINAIGRSFNARVDYGSKNYKPKDWTKLLGFTRASRGLATNFAKTSSVLI